MVVYTCKRSKVAAHVYRGLTVTADVYWVSMVLVTDRTCMLGSTVIPHIYWGSTLALHICRGSRVAAHVQGSRTCMFGINEGHMCAGDQWRPRINVRINSDCACMLAIICGCVCMSGDQRLPQMYVGDQRWPHMF